MKFQFGIEHEVAFVRSNSSPGLSPGLSFADFSNTTYEEFAAIIQSLPEYEGDGASLRFGDLGIRRKRWYIEGIERFDPDGNMVQCIPKGIEIRTTLHSSIAGAIEELQASFDLLKQAAKPFGLSPINTSFNPTQTEFIPTPPLNAYERDRMSGSPEDQSEHLPMLTYGPDLNLSVIGASTDQSIDWAKKLTYYSPYLIPFSYASVNPNNNQPIVYNDVPWVGESVRTFYRTGIRPAALVFLDDRTAVIPSDPSLTKLTLKPSEVGRIEFKAFDSCGDFDRYGSLLALLKGLLMDTDLLGRAIVPHRRLHQKSARFGWRDDRILKQSQRLLTAAETALANDPDRALLAPFRLLFHNQIMSPSHPENPIVLF
jgi:hypothetical protein